MDPITILTALLPMIVQSGKAMINKWLGQKEFKAATIEEHIQIKDKELELFKAINAAGGSNVSYPWVEAIVRLQRPFVVACVLATWAYANYLDLEDMDAINNAAAVISFYLFGERTMLYLKKHEGP